MDMNNDNVPNSASSEQINYGGFETKVTRCEWQVVIQQVDQYGKDAGTPKVLKSWPTAEQAWSDLINHGFEHKHVKGRWIPNGATNGYEQLDVRYREVAVDFEDVDLSEMSREQLLGQIMYLQKKLSRLEDKDTVENTRSIKASRETQSLRVKAARERVENMGSVKSLKDRMLENDFKSNEVERDLYFNRFNKMKACIKERKHLFRRSTYSFEMTSNSLNNQAFLFLSFFWDTKHKKVFDHYPTNEDIWELLVAIYGKPKYSFPMPWE